MYGEVSDGVVEAQTIGESARRGCGHPADRWDMFGSTWSWVPSCTSVAAVTAASVTTATAVVMARTGLTMWQHARRIEFWLTDWLYLFGIRLRKIHNVTQVSKYNRRRLSETHKIPINVGGLYNLNDNTISLHKCIQNKMKTEQLVYATNKTACADKIYILVLIT